MITRGKTKTQHGRGISPGFCAAHSSILPNVVDDRESGSLLEEANTFYHTMNSTVEVPEIVNQYDSLIEIKLRPKALALLNRVANEGLHPYKALDHFVMMSRIFLHRSKKELERKRDLIVKLQQTELMVSSLEDRIRLKQESLLPEYVQKIESIRVIRKEFRKINQYSPKYPLKGRVRPFAASYDLVLKFRNKHREPLYAALNDLIMNNRHWRPDPAVEGFKKVLSLLEVNIWQTRGTVLPPYPLLSGVVRENGELVGMTEKELHSQKMEIINR